MPVAVARPRTNRLQAAGRPAGRWRLAVYDLVAGTETHSIDDQVVWLDNGHIIYGRERDGTASGDVWVVNADGTGAPRVLIPDASSPAIVSA